MKIDFDIDIDLGYREKLLAKIKHIPAAMLNVDPIRKHASGVYPVNIPYDPLNNMASIDYQEAEERGYIKLDLLNVHVYEKVKNEKHLTKLMMEPDWAMLEDYSVVKNLIHLSNHFKAMREMPEPINSIPRLAMFLAVIRPAKKHLIGKTWKEVNETVWDRDVDGYAFKKSHSLAYAMLVVVHLNLIKEEREKK